MFYQAFREKKQRGGTKAQRLNGVQFNQEEYKSLVIGIFNHEQVVPFPSPKLPIMEFTFATYKAVIKSIPWDLVWTLDYLTLHKHVKERMPICHCGEVRRNRTAHLGR
jgi:hypothetical protein